MQDIAALNRAVHAQFVITPAIGHGNPADL
jgi:hypothetical protein